MKEKAQGSWLVLFDADDTVSLVIDCAIGNRPPRYIGPLITVCGNVEIGLDSVSIFDADSTRVTVARPSAIYAKGARRR